MKRREPSAAPAAGRRSRLPGLILLAVGVAFVLLGILLGQDEAVFQKAIRVCLECIGIG